MRMQLPLRSYCPNGLKQRFVSPKYRAEVEIVQRRLSIRG